MENQFVRYFSGLDMDHAFEPSQNASVKETVLNCFFTVDKTWTITYCNKAAGRLIGMAPDRILGRNLWNEFEYFVPENFYDVFHQTFLKENPDHFEEYLGAMGSWLDVIVYHCDGDISVSFKSVHQPPNVDNLQLQLIRLNGLYRVVTEITSDCLWEWDLETKEIFWIDGGHKRLFGYEIENAVIPQSFWEDRIHPGDKMRVLTSLKHLKLVELDKIWQQEYRFKKADGRYAHVKDVGKIVADSKSGNPRMIGTTQDISERKSLESQLAAEKSKNRKPVLMEGFEAQEKERLEIAGELYNNLSQILSAAKLYIENARVDEKRRMECLMISSDYILRVINGIQALYKKLRVPGMYQSLYNSVRLVVEKYNKLYPVFIEFNINSLDEEDLADTLQLDLFRIIQELIDNTIKHADATHAWIDISRYRNEITLLVSDNGQGCDLLKVSMGMGIIQVLSYVDLYESRVDMISSPGNGYGFKVVLPLSGRRKSFPQLLDDYDE